MKFMLFLFLVTLSGLIYYTPKYLPNEDEIDQGQ